MASPDEDTQQVLEDGGGDDDAQPQVVDDAGDEADEKPQQRGKPSANAVAAKRRLDQEKAEMRQRIEALEAERSTLTGAKTTLDKLKTALSDTPPSTDEEAPPDPALYPEAYNKYLRDRETRLRADMQADATRIADTRYAQREATARNLRVEQEFLVARPDWDQDKFLEFARFLGTPARPGGRTRFNPTGDFGEWTQEDLDIAEMAFDRDGALIRERVRGRNAALDQVSGTRAPNPGQRKPGGQNDNRASNGMTMDEILEFADKKPQGEVSHLMRGLKADERQMVNRVIARMAADLEREGER